MLYQRLRARGFQNPVGPEPIFPAEAEVIFSFLPPWAFGTKEGGSLSRTSFSEINAQSGKREGVLHADKHRGRLWATSKNPLKPLEVCLQGPNQTYSLQGSKLTMRALVTSLADLDERISRIYYWLPVYLNLDFGDPPTIESVVVYVGMSSALWVPKLSANTIFVGDQSTQTDFVKSALSHVLHDTVAEPRLLAALEYFYSATRLITLGETPGEFLAEAILNFAKILEVLFGACEGESKGSMDRARSGLRSLEYSDEVIADFFIPAIVLRNNLGVGHPGLTLISPEDLEAVHWYADSVESKFRELLKKIISLPLDQRHFLKSDSTSVDKSLEKMLSTIRKARERADGKMSRTTIANPPEPIAPTSKY